MPQLQNNNVTPANIKQGNAPKTNSYIEEVKAVRDYSIPENANYEKQMAMNQIMNNIGERLQDFSFKAQQIDTENKLNDYQIERTRLTKQYEIDYQKNPKEEITQKYQKDLEVLKNNYEKQVSILFKNNFLNRINQQDKQDSLNLEFFRKETELNYQVKKYVDNTNNELMQVRNASANGDDELVAETVLKLADRKQSLINSFGELQGTDMYNDYTNKLLTGIINGKLTNNPKEVLEIAKIIEMSPEFNNKLTPEQIENYKQLATDKINKLEQSRKTKEEVEYFIETNDVMKDISTGKLKNYSDIVNRLIVIGADEYTSKLVMKYSGYSTQLPPELLQAIDNNKTSRTTGTINDNELNRKKTPLERQKYKSDLQEKIFAIMTGEDVLNDKDLKTKNTREVVSNRIKEINQLMIGGIAGGYITESEYDNFSTQLNPYLSQTLTATAKGNFNDDGGWLHLSIGYKDLNKVINKTLNLNGFEDVDPKTLERKVGTVGSFLDKAFDRDRSKRRLTNLEKEKYYFIKNRITDNYIKSMEQQFKIMKENDKTGKYANVNNWIEFQDYVDYDTRKQMYNTAQNYTIEQYAKNDLNIDTTPYIDPKTGIITNVDGIKQEIEIKKEQETMKDLNSLLDENDIVYYTIDD